MRETRFKTERGRKCSATMKAKRARKRVWYDKCHKRLRAVWRKRGFSVERVAKRSGLDVRRVQRYYDGPLPIGGKWSLCVDTLFPLAYGLDCTGSYILGMDEKPGSWATQERRFERVDLERKQEKAEEALRRRSRRRRGAVAS